MRFLSMLTEKQMKKLGEWKAEQEDILGKDSCETAIGGAITYSFTPTNLGTVIKVRNDLTENEIDLTNYEDW